MQLCHLLFRGQGLGWLGGGQGFAFAMSSCFKFGGKYLVLGLEAKDSVEYVLGLQARFRTSGLGQQQGTGERLVFEGAGEGLVSTTAGAGERLCVFDAWAVVD